MSIAGILGRWFLVSAFTGVLALFLVPGARAQNESSAPADSPAGIGSSQPVPMAPSAGPLNYPDLGDASTPGMVPVTPPPAPEGAPAGLSALEVVRASLFDDIYSDEAKARWTPLYLSTYFSEGWNTPFVLPTSSSAGAPRQGWVGAFDGQFFRAWFFAFAYDQGVNQKIGNGYVGRYTIFAPLNRRLEFQVDSLFIVSNKGGASNTYHGNMGDNTFWLKTLLCETKNYGYGFALGYNAPTGRTENGQGNNALTTSFRGLWFPFGGMWMIRGETGPVIPFAHTGCTQYTNVLAAGRYFPGSKESWFQQWWFYLVATQSSTISGTPRHETSFSLSPGIRCKLTGRAFENVGTGLWYFLANVNVPMTGPQAFSYQPIFALLYDY